MCPEPPPRNDTNRGKTGRGVSRRDVLKAAGVSGLATGLAGCTALGENTDTDAVQWYAGPQEADSSDEIQKALYAAGLSEDISIEILPGPSNTDQKQQQLQRWLDAGLENPDIILMDSGWTIPFIARDQTLNLTKSDRIPDSFVKRVEKDFFESSLQTVSDPETGDLHGVPSYPDFATMLYRRDLVEKAGYKPKKQNWATESVTWKRFAQIVSDVLEQNSGVDYGYNFQASAYEGLSCCDFNEFMSSWGGAYFGGIDDLFGPIGDRPVTIDKQPVIDAIKMARTFIAGSNGPGTLDDFPGPISPRAVLSWIEDSSMAPFTNGNAVALRNWSYAITTNGPDDVLGDKLGVMPLPYGVSEKKSPNKGLGGISTALGGWHNTINPNSDKVEKAFEVIKATTKPSYNFKLLELLGRIPPQPKLLNSRRAKKVPIIGDYVEQLRVAGQNAVPRPVTVVWPQESIKIAQQINSAIGGGTTPERAATTLQQQIQEIERYNRDGN